VERDPKRFFDLENPKDYTGDYGERGHDEQSIHDGNYFVNGIINKTDGGFLRGFFFSELPNTNIILGPYPLYEIDVDKMKAAGVSTVLNLQIGIEPQQRGVNER